MKKYLLAICFLALALTGCKKSLTEMVMPESSGAPYELYVVMPEELRGSPLDDSIKAVFEYPMECTPNGDEYFHLRYLTPDNFRSAVIKIVTNVFVVDIDGQNSAAPVVKMERDKYALHQVIVNARAKQADTLAAFMPQLQEKLRSIFVRNELNRRIETVLDKDHNRTQGERLQTIQNVAMLIPDYFRYPGVGAADSSFFWCTDNGMAKESHLVVYSIPYTDQKVFSLEGAVAVRDSVMKANIKGGTEGSYMTTNKKVVLPEYKAISIGGKYVGELRGMWRMENGLMAGPFVCHIRLDEVNNRVVFAEGFCYAPNDTKRVLLRNLEASLWTLRLPSDNRLPEIEVTL